MIIRIWWTRLAAEDGRFFVFSPRFGATYLLDNEHATNTLLPLILGLSASNFLETLADPAQSIALTGAFEKPLGISSNTTLEDCKSSRVGWLLPTLYVLFHRLRPVFTIRMAMHLANWLPVVGGQKSSLSGSDIGKLVWATEHVLGISDCYPRALLTAFLCVKAQLNCKITIGILAPTAKLHAWCSAEGMVPFEPVYRNWWYNPLIVADVTL